MNRAARCHKLPALPVNVKPRLARRLLTVAKVLLGCGIISSVLYVASDLLASLRWYPGYRYRDQTFSELLAAGAPTRPRMVVLAGTAYGALVAAFGVGVWVVGGTRRARGTGALLVGYAITGTVTGVGFRMNTRATLAAGEGDRRNRWHPVGTAVQSLWTLLAMGFGAGLLGRRFRGYSMATILTLIVGGVATFPYVPRMAANKPTPWMGVLERINIYATMLWVAVLATALWRRHWTRTPRHCGSRR